MTPADTKTKALDCAAIRENRSPQRSPAAQIDPCTNGAVHTWQHRPEGFWGRELPPRDTENGAFLPDARE